MGLKNQNIARGKDRP